MILFGGALVLAYSGLAMAGPYLDTDRRFGNVVLFFGLPLWLFLPMLAGLAVLFAAWALKDSTRLPAWGCLMLFLLWLTQASRQAGLFTAIPQLGDQDSIWVTQTSFHATRWGLLLLAGALVAVVATEWLLPLARRTEAEGSEPSATGGA
jgi:hypothetical protein